jgi:hypothetical protein
LLYGITWTLDKAKGIIWESKSLNPLYSKEYSLVKQREETRILIFGIYSGVGSNGVVDQTPK